MAKTRISLGHWLKGEEIEKILKFIEIFNQSHPNIEVVPQIIGDTEEEMVEKILTSPLDATSPEVIITYSEKLALLAEKERIVPLDDWLLISPQMDMENFPPQIWGCVTYRSKIWGMPLLEGNPYCLLYNHLSFKESKIENPPRTLEELLRCASLLTKDRDKDGLTDQWGFTFQPYHFLLFLWQQGGDILDKETDALIFNQAEGVEVLNFILDLINFCAPFGNSIQEKTVIRIERITNYLPDFNKYRVASLPRGKRRINTFGSMMGPLCIAIINRKKQDAAWEFIRFWEDDKNLLNWSLMTNYLPLKKTVLYQDEYQEKIKKYPFLEILIEELKFAKAIPCSLIYPKARKFLEEGLSIINTKDGLDKTSAQKFLDLIKKNLSQDLKT